MDDSDLGSEGSIQTLDEVSMAPKHKFEDYWNKYFETHTIEEALYKLKAHNKIEPKFAFITLNPTPSGIENFKENWKKLREKFKEENDGTPNDDGQVHDTLTLYSPTPSDIKGFEDFWTEYFEYGTQKYILRKQHTPGSQGNIQTLDEVSMEQKNKFEDYWNKYFETHSIEEVLSKIKEHNKVQTKSDLVILKPTPSGIQIFEEYWKKLREKVPDTLYSPTPSDIKAFEDFWKQYFEIQTTADVNIHDATETEQNIIQVVEQSIEETLKFEKYWRKFFETHNIKEALSNLKKLSDVTLGTRVRSPTASDIQFFEENWKEHIERLHDSNTIKSQLVSARQSFEDYWKEYLKDHTVENVVRHLEAILGKPLLKDTPIFEKTRKTYNTIEDAVINGAKIRDGKKDIDFIDVNYYQPVNVNGKKKRVLAVNDFFEHLAPEECPCKKPKRKKHKSRSPEYKELVAFLKQQHLDYWRDSHITESKDSLLKCNVLYKNPHRKQSLRIQRNPPEKISKRKKRKPLCPVRCIELAAPTKRLVLENWRSNYKVLPAHMVERLKKFVYDETPIVRVREAVTCFQIHEKCKKRKPKKMPIDKRKIISQINVCDAQNFCALFAHKIIRNLSSPLNITPSTEIYYLSRIIAWDILKLLRKRSSINIESSSNMKILLNVSEMIAVWIHNVLQEVNLKLLDEELEDISTLSDLEHESEESDNGTILEGDQGVIEEQHKEQDQNSDSVFPEEEYKESEESSIDTITEDKELSQKPEQISDTFIEDKELDQEPEQISDTVTEDKELDQEPEEITISDTDIEDKRLNQELEEISNTVTEDKELVQEPDQISDTVTEETHKEVNETEEPNDNIGIGDSETESINVNIVTEEEPLELHESKELGDNVSSEYVPDKIEDPSDNIDAEEGIEKIKEAESPKERVETGHFNTPDVEVNETKSGDEIIPDEKALQSDKDESTEDKADFDGNENEDHDKPYSDAGNDTFIDAMKPLTDSVETSDETPTVENKDILYEDHDKQGNDTVIDAMELSSDSVEKSVEKPIVEDKSIQNEDHDKQGNDTFIDAMGPLTDSVEKSEEKPIVEDKDIQHKDHDKQGNDTFIDAMEPLRDSVEKSAEKSMVEDKGIQHEDHDKQGNDTFIDAMEPLSDSIEKSEEKPTVADKGIQHEDHDKRQSQQYDEYDDKWQRDSKPIIEKQAQSADANENTKRYDEVNLKNINSIVFAPPNENLLSDADENWPHEKSTPSHIIASITKSIQSLGKIPELYETSPNELSENISIHITTGQKPIINEQILIISPGAKGGSIQDVIKPATKTEEKKKRRKDNSEAITSIPASHDVPGKVYQSTEKYEIKDIYKTKSFPPAKFEYNVDYSTAPSWVFQNMKKTEKPDKKALVNTKDNRKWCEELLQTTQNLELWNDWIHNACEHIILLSRNSRSYSTNTFPKAERARRSVKAWHRLKKDVDADALLWTRLHYRTQDSLRKHTIKKLQRTTENQSSCQCSSKRTT